MSLNKVFVIFILFFLTARCPNSTSDNEKLPSLPESNSIGGGSLSDLQSATNGWQDNCQQEQGSQEINKMTFTNNTILLITYVYEDGFNCSNGHLIETFRVSYSSSSDGVNSTNSQLTNLNMTMSKVEMMPNTTTFAATLNSGVSCGKSDWVAGQIADITNSSCVTGIGNTIYSTFQISNNTLKFGDTTGAQDGTSLQKRPTTLNSIDSYTRF